MDFVKVTLLLERFASLAKARARVVRSSTP
jgi:hypothetical protein